jgi:hypothetical protein
MPVNEHTRVFQESARSPESVSSNPRACFLL